MGGRRTGPSVLTDQIQEMAKGGVVSYSLFNRRTTDKIL